MPKKILLVDDEPDVLRVASFRLKKAGYEVITTVNGQEALDILKKDKFDLVMLDVRMPLITGDEVSRRIKSDSALGQIPVILFTASVAELEHRFKESKADDYLAKPFDPDILLTKVAKLLQK